MSKAAGNEKGAMLEMDDRKLRGTGSVETPEVQFLYT